MHFLRDSLSLHHHALWPGLVRRRTSTVLFTGRITGKGEMSSLLRTEATSSLKRTPCAAWSVKVCLPSAASSAFLPAPSQADRIGRCPAPAIGA